MAAPSLLACRQHGHSAQRRLLLTSTSPALTALHTPASRSSRLLCVLGPPAAGTTDALPLLRVRVRGEHARAHSCVRTRWLLVRPLLDAQLLLAPT